MGLKDYTIPLQYRRPLHALLDSNRIEYLDDIEYNIFEDMQQTLDAGPILSSYVKFFSVLLWLEELKETLDVKKYDMDNVNLTMDKGSGYRRSVQLKVPGLAERRPSLILGDIVCAKLRFDVTRTPFIGVISKVEFDQIVINEFDDKFLNQIDENTKIDISFNLSRAIHFRMHRAVHFVAQQLTEKIFPEKVLVNVEIEDFAMFNEDLEQNEEQKRAVKNIVANSSGIAPFIVFGPPGTGKTVTIVEAIHQIIDRIPGARVLVCAPSNMACDLLTEKLAERMDASQLIRVYSNTRAGTAIPNGIHAYTNHSDEKGFERFSASQLNRFKVIVCTLVHAGQYTRQSFCETEWLKLSHVFIDEAGQAKEPECLIPLGGLVDLKTSLILAGDPKQLGPFVTCIEANNFGLGTSLLERLMSTCSLYNVDPSCRDSNYVTKLVKNFRSHPAILKISNDKFYDKELEACSIEAKTDPIILLNILEGHFRNGHAITFHSVYGDETRNGGSPSYFNVKELEVVMQYVSALLSTTCPIKVHPSDIGIISPYIRQVQMIRDELWSLGILKDIEIGSTEAFQGREKRIMIISTVRGSTNLLWYDRRYKLGFISDEKRFNVAMTRAKSKLIVVGNPNSLMAKERQNCWPDYLTLCSSYKSHIGYKYQKLLNDNLTDDVIHKFKQLRLTEIEK